MINDAETLVNDLKETVRDNFFKMIDEKLSSKKEIKILIDKKEEVLTKIHQYHKFIDDELDFIQSKVNELSNNFSIRDLQKEGLSVIKLDQLNLLENEILNSYIRNKRMFEMIKRINMYSRKLITNIFDMGGMSTGESLSEKKKFSKLLDEEQLISELQSIENKFSMFLEIYEETMKIVKQKGYLIKNMIELLKFNSGNI